jgi:hypothetical protein
MLRNNLLVLCSLIPISPLWRLLIFTDYQESRLFDRETLLPNPSMKSPNIHLELSLCTRLRIHSLSFVLNCQKSKEEWIVGSTSFSIRTLSPCLLILKLLPLLQNVWAAESLHVLRLRSSSPYCLVKTLGVPKILNDLGFNEIELQCPSNQIDITILIWVQLV